MDTNVIYRDIVKLVLLKYEKLRPSHGDIRLDVVFDEFHAASVGRAGGMRKGNPV